MSERYVLNGHEPVLEPDLMAWAQWFEKAQRHVAETFLDGDDGQVRISTVFLGLDHRFGGNGRPILFETMVFGGPCDQDGDRYCTWDEAQAGHDAFVAKCRAGVGTQPDALAR